MLATQNGNLDAVKLLVQSRANIDLLAKDRQGKTILQLAENHPAVKKYLETCNEVNKAMITIGNIHVDSTPEERQKAEESIEIIKKFINTRVIDANHSNTNGDTLLHAAVKGNRLDMVKFLVENGADTNKCEPKSDTPLQEAIRTSKDPKIVEYLLNKSTVDLDRKGVGNETPLETAALFGSPEVLSPVLSKYDTAHLNTPNENGKTPIMLAAQNGKTENVKKLIEAGADPNVSGIKNKSALLLAAEAGNREIIDFLKEKGANQEITNSEGLTADRLLEKMEIQKHDRNILKQLAELLKPNMSTEDVTKVKNLIETIKDGENLNIEYAEGNFILLRAVESDNQEIMELLIAKGARIDTMDSRWNGTLETAIMYKNLDMIKFLFKEMKEQGTSIAENPKLQASILEGFLGRTIDRTFDPDILEFLIDQGVDVINTKFRGDEMMQEIAENSLEKAINRETEGIDDSPENQQKIERLKNLIKSIETELAKSEMKSTAQTSTEPPTNPQ
jgi:ankyrin repeat protein